MQFTLNSHQQQYHSTGNKIRRNRKEKIISREQIKNIKGQLSYSFKKCACLSKSIKI